MPARFLAACALLCCAAAHAQTDASGASSAAPSAASPAAGLSIYGAAGSTGLTLGLARRMVPQRATLRAEFSAASWSTDFDRGAIEYSGRLSLRAGALLADWHPTRGTWRLTAGVFFNDTSLEASGRPGVAGTLTIDRVRYPVGPDDRLDARFELPSVAPYLGLGVGGLAAEARGWGVFADAGVMFGRPSVSLTATPSLTALVGRAAIEAERAELQDKADQFRYFPVLRIGARYQF